MWVRKIGFCRNLILSRRGGTGDINGRAIVNCVVNLGTITAKPDSLGANDSGKEYLTSSFNSCNVPASRHNWEHQHSGRPFWRFIDGHVKIIFQASLPDFGERVPSAIVSPVLPGGLTRATDQFGSLHSYRLVNQQPDQVCLEVQFR